MRNGTSYKCSDDANTSIKRPYPRWDLQRVTIVRPGGNDTAIVWDEIPRQRQGELSKVIQAAYPEIEQVMFVELGQNGLVRGQMAGGEFCGNAARSLGYMLLQGKNGEINLEISGACAPLTVITENGMAQTSIPIIKNLDSAVAFNEDYIVHMYGISFIITCKCNSLGAKIMAQQNADKKKQVVLGVLKETHFSSRYAASGIMIIEDKGNMLFTLDPFVFVKETETLYYESGCGSGSTSIGIMIAKETGLSVNNLRIVQPSGMELFVTIDRSQDHFETATVNGPIKILFDGSLIIPFQESGNKFGGSYARAVAQNCI